MDAGQRSVIGDLLEQERTEEKMLDADAISSILDPFDLDPDLSSEDSDAIPEEKDMELLSCFVFSG